MLPVNDRDPALYSQGLFPSLPFSRDDDGDNIIDGGPGNANSAEGSELLSLLEQCRQLIVSNGLGANESTFLTGWIAGNPLSGNGLGGIGGRTAYSNTDPIRGQRSYAHELTHNLGFDHVSNTIDEVGWDVGARLVNNPAANNTLGRVKPTTLRDIQVPGLLTNEAWIDTPKYTSLLGSTTLGFGSGDSPAGDIKRQARRRVVAITGTLDPKGQRVVRLDPAFRYPWLSQPTPSQTGDYVAEVVTTTGGVIRARFSGQIADDGKVEGKAFGSFAAMIPTSGQIASVRIRNLRTRKVLRTLKRSRADAADPRPAAAARLGPGQDHDRALERLGFRHAARSADLPGRLQPEQRQLVRAGRRGAQGVELQVRRDAGPAKPRPGADPRVRQRRHEHRVRGRREAVEHRRQAVSRRRGSQA